MSSYGDNYSDEERNFIQHGGASRGESDIEGESEGEGVVESGEKCEQGGSGGEGSNGEGSATPREAGGSGVAERPDGDAHDASGSEAIAVTRGTRDAAEGSSSGWDVHQNGSGGWNEYIAQKIHPGFSSGGESSGNTSGNTSGGEELEDVPWGYQNDPPPESLPIGHLTAEEFCERLKLFRSPDVTIIVGPEEFKEGVEQAMRLPEDTVLAFQMMLHWDAIWRKPETTGIYLDFFKLADKIDLLGPLNSIVNKFREHLNSVRGWHNRSDCTNKCGLGYDENGATLSCTCGRARGVSPPVPHNAYCDAVYSNCPSKQNHIDILRDGIVTSEHIHAAFELRPNHEVCKILSQACVTSYLLSNTMDFEFRFTKELETVDGFCQALLKEVSRTVVKNSKILDPLSKIEGKWPPESTGFHLGWGPG
ncbi:hypothetical protein IFR05_002228 [Cadophora sp. M221]|nr:hypothetical protein IFR05_002228 [Cadophora sp. M221]